MNDLDRCDEDLIFTPSETWGVNGGSEPLLFYSPPVSDNLCILSGVLGKPPLTYSLSTSNSPIVHRTRKSTKKTASQRRSVRPPVKVVSRFQQRRDTRTDHLTRTSGPTSLYSVSVVVDARSPSFKEELNHQPTHSNPFLCLDKHMVLLPDCVIQTVHQDTGTVFQSVGFVLTPEDGPTGYRDRGATRESTPTT